MRNMPVKIFCVYHKDYEIFKSEVIEPIQTGCNFTDLDLGFLKDNTGDNIADKNPHYGELTAWYWVWKNYLVEHPEVEYIGFCHYRRFLDFQKKENKKSFSTKISPKILMKDFKNKYTNQEIYPMIINYDIILPKKYKMRKSRGTVYKQYIDNHPKIEIDKMISIIKQYYPEYITDMENYLNGNTSYFCLNFVLKREYFEELVEWVFDLLSKMEPNSNWEQYTEYSNIRTPAYLIERFINVWINYKVRTQGMKVLERKSYTIESSVIRIFPGIKIIKSEKHIVISVFNIKISIKK